MAYEAKACTKKSYRQGTGITASVLGALGILSIVMLIVNLIEGKVLFGIAWLIAAILCITYVIIRLNAVFSTFLAVDKKNVYMKTWSNGFLPYKVESRITVLSEFLPAHTVLIEIPIEDITTVVIGNKNFIKRVGVDCENFKRAIHPYEISKDPTRKKAVNTQEYFYVSTFDEECYFMPLDKFSTRDVTRVIQLIQRTNNEADVKVNSRQYRTSLKER